MNRVLAQPTIFDPATNGSFSLNSPPAPWIDLGWIDNFSRKSESKIAPFVAGAPAAIAYQTRQGLGASVSFHFKTWSKLSMALAGGAQHMNVLAAPENGTAIGSGGKGIPAVTLGTGSSASALVISGNTALTAGSIVTVDFDYVGQTGFIGTGVSAAYVSTAALVGSDVDYIRRVSFNVGRVVEVASGTLQLAQPLPAGIPAAGMKLQQVVGFVDREGGSFFQEWSALFVIQGEQGDRVLLHYPRLQSMITPEESSATLASTLESVALAASFRALSVTERERRRDDPLLSHVCAGS